MFASHSRPLSFQFRLLMGILILALGAATTQAAAPQSSINSIVHYLDTRSAGTQVLSVLHFGADYHGHEFIKTTAVTGRPDDFAVIYRYHWADDGITDVAFLCDKNGSVYDIQVQDTNAVLSQPFTMANLAIQTLGEIFLESNGDHMTAQDRHIAQTLIQNADAKGLLVFFLP